MTKSPEFIPALKFSWLSHLYDPLVKLARLDKVFYQTLLKQGSIEAADTVLDFGCGTGSFCIMAKKLVPKAEVHGLDIDPYILQIAEKKTKRENLDIFLKIYDGTSFPYEDDLFDKVFSSLVFHHLTREDKTKALQEIHRTLKPGGELHLLDFGQGKNIFMRGAFLLIQLFDGFATTQDNIKGHLPLLVKKTGFTQVREKRQILTPVGPISLYKAVKQ